MEAEKTEQAGRMPKNRKILTIILIAVNALLLFELIGMPKYSITEQVDYLISQELMDDPDYHRYTDRKYYLTVTDVTITDKDGFPVNYSEGAKLSFNITNARLDRAMNPDKYGEDGIEIGGRIISESAFKDTTKFMDITVDVRERCRELEQQIKAERPRMTLKVIAGDIFWFTAMPKTASYSAVLSRLLTSLVFALIAAGLGVYFYFTNTEKVISIYKALIALKALAFVFVFLLLKR